MIGILYHIISNSSKVNSFTLGTLFVVFCLSCHTILEQTSFLETSGSITSSAPLLPEDEDIRISTQKLLTVNNNTRFCLVHVGKTSGSKIGCEVSTTQSDRLRPHLKCKNLAPTVKNNALAKAFAGRIHMQTNNCKPPYQFFLYTLRNPLDRIVSWFHYERRLSLEGRDKNACLHRIHEECFTTVDEFARAAISNYSNAKTVTGKESCSKLAWRASTGKYACTCHNTLNYEHYLNLTAEGEEMYENLTLHNITITEQSKREVSKKPILVIRQEHLAEDWDSLLNTFDHDSRGSMDGTLLPGSVIFNSTAGAVSTFSGGAKALLSKEGRANLCTALCREIQMYKYLLLQAWNLDDNQAKESILEVMSLCPEETFEIRTCPSKERPRKKFEKISSFVGVSKEEMLSSYTKREQLATFTTI